MPFPGSGRTMTSYLSALKNPTSTGVSTYFWHEGSLVVTNKPGLTFFEICSRSNLLEKADKDQDENFSAGVVWFHDVNRPVCRMLQQRYMKMLIFANPFHGYFIFIFKNSFFADFYFSNSWFFILLTFVDPDSA